MQRSVHADEAPWEELTSLVNSGRYRRLARSAARRHGSWLTSRRPAGSSPSSGMRTGMPCLMGKRTEQREQTSCCSSRVSVASRAGSRGQRSRARKPSSMVFALPRSDWPRRRHGSAEILTTNKKPPVDCSTGGFISSQVGSGLKCVGDMSTHALLKVRGLLKLISLERR